MAAFLKHSLGWLVSVAILAVLCVVLGIVSLNLKYSCQKAQADMTVLAAQLESREEQLAGLKTTADRLSKENTELSDQISENDLIRQNDVLILDRSLPLDLVATVLTYYQSKADKDDETYKSVIVPDGEQREFMLGSFDFLSGPNHGEGVQNMMLLGAGLESGEDIGSSSFEGNVTVTVNAGLSSGEYLYLRKDSGSWYVWNWD